MTTGDPRPTGTESELDIASSDTDGADGTVESVPVPSGPLPGLEVLLAPIPALLGIGVCASSCWALGWQWALIPFLLLGIGGSALAVIDLRLMRLPNKIVLPLYVTGLIGLAAASVPGAHWNRLVISLICLALFYGIFYVLAVFGPMGFGDVKLVGVLGLHLGWLGFQYAYAGILLGTLSAALGALVLIPLRRKAWRRSKLAYGPYLLFGSWLAVLLYGFAR
ncbi:MAG TPA: A24 family peptidase [Actinocrinis sp.]|nr:A24 family peptidase [Actinocrinis sp.]